MNRTIQILKFSVSVLLLAVLPVLLAGCTGKKSGEDLSNTLRMQMVAKIKGLDPQNTSDVYAHRNVDLVYEGLLKYHYLKRPYELVPNLAAEMPKVSADKKTITFKIRTGVLFQDDEAFKTTQGKGRELTAKDFVYSWMRLADPKVASDGWWTLDGRIEGLNEWREARKAGTADFDTPVSGLKTVDKYTFEIRLTKPNHLILYFMAMPYLAVVPREAVEFYGKDFLRNPVGTGPFKLVRAESSVTSKLVWERNPTFREMYYPSEGTAEDKKNGMLADAGKRIPFVDKVIYEVLIESQPRWLKFMNGDIDRLIIPKDNFASAITPSKDLSPEMAEKGIYLQKIPSMDVTHTSFNLKDPLFATNKKLRQALSLVHNIGPYIELFFNGTALPAQGPIPPGMDGYDANFKNEVRQYNLTKAKKLLAEAGYPEGKGLPELQINFTASTSSRQISEYFQKSLATIGVKSKLNPYTWPEFIRQLRNLKGHMWSYGWVADYPDAENFLQLFYSKNTTPGPNDAYYKNPTFDALYEQSVQEFNTKKRVALYKKMASIVIDDAPWIWMIHRVDYYLFQGRVKNAKIHQFEGSAPMYYRIDNGPAKSQGQI